MKLPQNNVNVSKKPKNAELARSSNVIALSVLLRPKPLHQNLEAVVVGSHPYVEEVGVTVSLRREVMWTPPHHPLRSMVPVPPPL